MRFPQDAPQKNPKECLTFLFLPKHPFNCNLGNTPFYKSHTPKGFGHSQPSICKGAALLWYLLRSSQVCQYRCKNLLIQMAVLIALQYESGKPLQFEFPKSKLPLWCMERQNRRARLLHSDLSCELAWCVEAVLKRYKWKPPGFGVKQNWIWITAQHDLVWVS